VIDILVRENLGFIVDVRVGIEHEPSTGGQQEVAVIRRFLQEALHQLQAEGQGLAS